MNEFGERSNINFYSSNTVRIDHVYDDNKQVDDKSFPFVVISKTESSNTSCSLSSSTNKVFKDNSALVGTTS